MPPSSRATRPHLPTSPFAAAETVVPDLYEVDDRVAHDRHGMGRVVGVEPRGIVVVDFGSRIVRVLADRRLCKL